MKRVAMALGVAGVVLSLVGGTAPPTLAPATASPAPPPRTDSFPHLSHQGLFPLCQGCHEGVPSGDESDYYPEPSLCTGCHDGVDVAELETPWEPPVPNAGADLLDFRHPDHIGAVDAVGDAALTCQTCHVPPGGGRLEVEPLVGQQCLTCHAHEADLHYEDADCATCHIPLASSRLPAERIASLPQPSAHANEDFLPAGHGSEALEGTADCATCHTRDLCTSCHVGGNEETLGALERAPVSLSLPAHEPSYPTPASHTVSDFRMRHGDLFEDVADCVTCHTRDDCASCHLEPLPAGVRTLPPLDQVRAPGVGLQVAAPASHDSPFFQADHTTLAAADPDGCATCHTQPFCEACHDAPTAPVFHAPNYVASHAADAWGGTSECASCHQVQVSCRACHVQAGLTQTGRLGPGFHDAEPIFLLRHGQAARQSLESCASCHTQRECLQCHSQTGAFRISPHGPDFDAERAQARNPQICSACHLRNPLGGGGG